MSFSPTLFTNGAFNGTVTQAAAPGVAVPLATVTVSGAELPVPRVLVVDGSSEEFNEADFFPPGDYTLVAEAPGFVPITTSRTIPVGSPSPITIGFEMSLRPRLRVTVVAPTGTSSGSTVFSPVLDATVTLNPPATGTSGDLDKAVNSSGVAEFAEEQSLAPGAESTQLEPGTYTIDVVAPNYDTFTGHLETGVAIGETREVTIALTGTAGGFRELRTARFRTSTTTSPGQLLALWCQPRSSPASLPQPGQAMSRRYHLSLSRRQPTKTVSGRLTNTDSAHRRTPCQPPTSRRAPSMSM